MHSSSPRSRSFFHSSRSGSESPTRHSRSRSPTPTCSDCSSWRSSSSGSSTSGSPIRLSRKNLKRFRSRSQRDCKRSRRIFSDSSSSSSDSSLYSGSHRSDTQKSKRSSQNGSASRRVGSASIYTSSESSSSSSPPPGESKSKYPIAAGRIRKGPSTPPEAPLDIDSETPQREECMDQERLKQMHDFANTKSVVNVGPGDMVGKSVAPGENAGVSVAPGENAGESVAPGENAGESVTPGENTGKAVAKFDILRQLAAYFKAKAMRQKEPTRKTKRRSHSYEWLQDDGTLIDELLTIMRNAAEQDRKLNLQRKPAVNKLLILSQVLPELTKPNLQSEYLEHNILSVLADWLSPLPDNSLTSFQIRDAVIRLLEGFHNIDKMYLARSCIGKTVMYLTKHPEETNENRKRARRLVERWARPVFNLGCDLKSLTTEQREEINLKKYSRKQAYSAKMQSDPKSTEATFTKKADPKPKEPTSTKKAYPKPMEATDLGFRVPPRRARVPQLHVRTYINRPVSQVDRNAPAVVPPLSSIELRIKKITRESRRKGPKK